MSLEDVLKQLETVNPAVADEIQALQAIFGQDKIGPIPSDDAQWRPGQTFVSAHEMFARKY